MSTFRLLERESELAQVAAAARAAAAGHGHVVLVSGEAGIGKSSIVRAVRGLLPAEGRMLVGHCDDLSTARTLGPFQDLVGSVGAELGSALREGADRDLLLAALRADLDGSARPTLLVIEDVHWADNATLDVLRFLIRRVAELPVVLLLTYRDDELGRGHPLQQVLGMVDGQAWRLGLRRLSPAAVEQLCAGTSLDAGEVFAVTAGNPFFVGEVLAAGAGAEVSRSVVDAVRARLGRLDDAGRAAVEQLSVVPTEIERRLVEALVPGGLAALDGAEERGLVGVTPWQVSFRHELTRRAVVDALPAVRRERLNARVLAVLVEDPATDAARIVHHAAAAGDRAAVVRFGPVAARSAASGGAHREAAAHYRLVLEHADAFAPAERAELFGCYAIACYVIGDSSRSVPAQEQAVALFRGLGDAGGLGAGLHWLSRMRWIGGDRPAAEAAAVEAVEVLEAHGDRRLLALAYSNQAHLDMVAMRATAATQVAERAVALARETGDTATLSHALNNLGTARGLLGQPDGPDLVAESLRIALDAGHVDDAGRAFENLAWLLMSGSQLRDAEGHIKDGIAFADEAGHVLVAGHLMAVHADLNFRRGDWAAAEESAQQSLVLSPQFPYPARTVLARLRARRGDPGAAAELAAIAVRTRTIQELQMWAAAAAGAAEEAWLRGDDTAVGAVAADPYAELLTRDDPIFRPELAFWLQKANHPVAAQIETGPYGLLLAGRWREAAKFWEDAGCRYEQALALTESPDPPDLLAALEALDGLGAQPLARRVREQLRRLGVAAVPRGPTRSTRQNPGGLTGRQLEVLSLVADGMTNTEIADRLVVSIRTVENHMAAVFTKLDVRSRAQAVERVRELS